VRICFLGNSHLACVAQAIAESCLFQPSQYDIFRVGGGGQPRLKCENRTLVPVNSYVEEWLRKSSGGKTHVDLDAYDAFVIVAAGQHAVREEFANPFKDIVISSLNGKAYLPEVDIGERFYVSLECAKRAIRGWLRQLGAVQVLRDICSQVGAPVIATRCPLPTESYFERSDNTVSMLHGSTAKEVWEQWSRLHIEALSEVVGAIGGNLTLLPYPSQALTNNGCTLRKYETSDPWHMNGAYGHLLLDAIAQSFDGSLLPALGKPLKAEGPLDHAKDVLGRLSAGRGVGPSLGV